MRIIVITAVLCMAAGCAGSKQCIKIDGGYDGIEGGIEYCFSEAETDAAGVPAVTDSDGDNSYIVGESWIDTILEMLGSDEPQAGASAPSEEPGEPQAENHPMQRLKEEILEFQD